MTERRFTHKPDLDPGAVWSLPVSHPAMTENRTLFPSTVVDVDENFEGNLLVSGRNNRKLGETIAKGKFRNYKLYALTLEERATCSESCDMRAACYGNSMQMGRRHRITDLDLFATYLEDQIREILTTAPGLMIRLHVLGDFPSPEYVAMWGGLLDSHRNLACYGYTHWTTDDGIGGAVAALKGRFGDRFRIRWSRPDPAPDSAIVINHAPITGRIPSGLVCPAQTDATGCCASCGLCWEPAAKKDTIVFIKHGKKSLDQAAEATREAASEDSSIRGIRPIELPPKLIPKPIVEPTPEVRMARPKDLLIESAYQRDLSGRSIKLIRQIVANWDWSHFKPPVCAETKDGLFVIDGQHTAIAAATHPGITEIPVLVVSARKLETRASAFVAHNRDRLTMTPAQVFYGEVAGGDIKAKRVLDAVTRAGGSIPRSQPTRGYGKPGQIWAIGELRGIVNELPAPVADKLLRVAVKSGHAPVPRMLLRGLRILLTEKSIFARSSEERLIAAIASIPDIDSAARKLAHETGEWDSRACATLIGQALQKQKVAA